MQTYTMFRATLLRADSNQAVRSPGGAPAACRTGHTACAPSGGRVTAGTIRHAFSTQRILVGSSMYAGSRDSAAANKQLQVETPYASCYVRRSQRPRTVLNRALVSETSVKSGTHYCSGSFAPVQVASLHRSQT